MAIDTCHDLRVDLQGPLARPEPLRSFLRSDATASQARNMVTSIALTGKLNPIGHEDTMPYALAVNVVRMGRRKSG